MPSEIHEKQIGLENSVIAARLQTSLSRNGIETRRIRDALDDVACSNFVKGYDYCCKRMAEEQARSRAKASR